MARRPSRKRIHYVRAVYNSGAGPDASFESSLRQALKARAQVDETAVEIASHGIVQIRNRRTTKAPVLLAIGAGMPGEEMSTMGIDVDTAADTDDAEPPPKNRAFKIADAFVLVSGNEVLVCLDGMRTSTLRSYLSQFLAAALGTADVAGFELDPVHDLDQQEILAREGVKELELAGTMLEANNKLSKSDGPVARAWNKLVSSFHDILAKEADGSAEEHELAEELGNLNVRAIIHVAGGRRAEPVLHEIMAKAGIAAMDEEVSDASVTLVTTENTRISTDSLILAKYVNLSRQENKNDLSYFETWAALEEYQAELVNRGHWES